MSQIIIERTRIVEEARKFLGTRWLHQGRLKGVGVDCIGLVHQVAINLGLATEVVIPPYARQPANDMMRRLCEQHLYRISQPDVGSVVLMRFNDEPQHMGLLGDYPVYGFSLIHSYAKMRKVVEHRMDETWASRVVAYYDFPGVA